MKGLDFIYSVLKAENQRVRKQVVKGIRLSYKTRQNGMQKMVFYLAICDILEISEK